jgi:hypothetical protein
VKTNQQILRQQSASILAVNNRLVWWSKTLKYANPGWLHYHIYFAKCDFFFRERKPSFFVGG